MTNHNEQKNMQIGIATSVIIHAVLLFVFAWFIGLDNTARELWKAAQAMVAEPQVTLLFADQIITEVPPPAPVAEPVAQLTADPRRVFIESAGAKADAAPAMPDLISDRNTKAAARAAAVPDSNVPLPKIEIAKAEPTPMAKLMQQVNMVEPKLPLEVRKPDEPTALPSTPTALPTMRVAEDFVPTTKSSITNKGADSVDAMETPFARYSKQILAAMDRVWDKDRVTITGVGYAHFTVRRDGSVIVTGFDGPAAEVSVTAAFREAVGNATFPPIPADVLAIWPEGEIPVDYKIEPK